VNQTLIRIATRDRKCAGWLLGKFIALTLLFLGMVCPAQASFTYNNTSSNYVSVTYAEQIINYPPTTTSTTNHTVVLAPGDVYSLTDWSQTSGSSGTIHVFYQVGQATPIAKPTATITADTTTITLGQSTVIHADFLGNFNGSRLDLPEGTPVTDGSALSHRDYTFTPSSAGNYTFCARANAQYYPWATYGSVTISVLSINHPPSTSLNAASTSISFGQSTTISATATDQDGNLTSQSIEYLAPGASNWVSGSTWSGGSTASNQLVWNLSAAFFTTTGVWQFRASASDGQASSPYATASITVVKATPAISQLANQTYSTVHTVTAADLSALFVNPYTSSVTQPTGAVTYSIVSGGSGPLTVGTVLAPGTYTIQVLYAGDNNYNSNSSNPATATWTEVLADSFSYDDAGRLTSVKQANGLSHSYAPDEEANLQTVGHSSADTTYANGPGNGIPDWWEVANFGAPGIDPLAKPAGDGVSNLMKYMLGKNPLTAFSGAMVTASPLVYTDGNTYPIFTYTAAKDAATTLYMQQSSNGGASWQSGSAYFAQISVTDLGDGTVQIVVRCLTPMPAAANLLFRLKADGGTTGFADYSPSFGLSPSQFPASAPGSDVPAMPLWALAGLGVLLFFAAARFLRPATTNL